MSPTIRRTRTGSSVKFFFVSRASRNASLVGTKDDHQVLCETWQVMFVYGNVKSTSSSHPPQHRRRLETLPRQRASPHRLPSDSLPGRFKGDNDSSAAQQF